MRGEIQALTVFRHTEARLLRKLSKPVTATTTLTIKKKKTCIILNTSMLIYKNAYKPPRPKKTRGWIS